MSIYGPSREITPIDTDSSLYAGVRMIGRINMGGKKIVELGDPTEEQDAATAGYVSGFVSRLNNIKVNKDGDTMTGPLNMSQEKITNVGLPTDEKDVVTKEYVDSLVRKVSLHTVGRYIVFPNEEDGTKTYFSVRAKKNVDLDSDKLIV